MKLSTRFGAMVLAKESRESNGNTYYSLAILQDSQAGTISCKKEVFDFVDVMKEYSFTATYNDLYKSFSVNCIVPSGVDTVEKTSGTKAPVTNK